MSQKTRAVTVVLAGMVLAGCGSSAEEPAGVHTYTALPPPAMQSGVDPGAGSQPAPSAAPSSVDPGAAPGRRFRAVTGSGTVLTAVLGAPAPGDLAEYFEEMGASDDLSFATVTADPVDHLDDVSAPQLIGQEVPAVLEIASGTHGTGGHIGDAAPVQWGDGGEMPWTGEMVGAGTTAEYNDWASEHIAKYDSASGVGYLVYITDSDLTPEEVAAVHLDYGGRPLRLTPIE